MEYRRLGRSGLKLSQFSVGSWVTYDTQLDVRAAREILAAAWDHGVNFFDNAEAYAGGASEQIMGEAIRSLGWNRASYVVSTKFYWGLIDGPNTKNTLNRKYLRQGIDESLKRFGLDYIDLVYCHRPDPNTPIEETVWAMHDMIATGKALYWGTSEWSAAELRAAWDIAERHHLHKPVVEQPQYNLLVRRRVEQEYARLYEDIGLGLTTFSPLASGILTGKYLKGAPAGSRASLESMAWFRDHLLDPAKNQVAADLGALAADLGVSLTQLSLAWCTRNPHVSSVITGASSVAQLTENMKALAVVPRLTPDVLARIEEITAGRYS